MPQVTARRLAALLIAVALAGCSHSGEDAPTPESAGSAAGSAHVQDRFVELVRTPWVGDLDGMLERRLIRVLIVPSRTMYFVDKGMPGGMAVEYQAAFEDYINKRFPPKARHLKTNVVLVPTSREDLLTAVLEGRGDIAASHLTITPDREVMVVFSEPTSGDVNEIVVTGRPRRSSTDSTI